MRLNILASGSSGNAIVVTSSRGESLLIDQGLSFRELQARAKAARCPLDTLSALLVTHEHADHISGIAPLLRKTSLRCFLTEGTATAVEAVVRNRARIAPAGFLWDIFEAGQSFQAAGMDVESFATSHDAADPVAFAVSDGDARIAFATDTGVATQAFLRHLRDCDALVLEANHDPGLLRDSKRPWSLKQRIAGRQGHLSNEQCADVLEHVAGPRLKAVYLAHVSCECNSYELALQTVRGRLHRIGRDDVIVRTAFRDKPSDPLSL
ncbi:MAG: MBL fold metallo-hydrolase [Kiritimatiellia bacterium]|jgi:phosphoribosyl 1,2-cyclic phosphodiesterase